MPTPTHRHPAPSAHICAVPAPAVGRQADVIELIMADHRRIRRLGDAVYDAARYRVISGPDWILTAAWQRLAALVEVHTQAEEEICYLSMFGPGPQGTARKREAIADHDDIREAISEASLCYVGSATWWRAVRAVLAVSAEHLDREERGVLAECLASMTMSRRQQLGGQWSAFVAAWRKDVALRTAVPPPSRSGILSRP